MSEEVRCYCGPEKGFSIDCPCYRAGRDSRTPNHQPNIRSEAKLFPFARIQREMNMSAFQVFQLKHILTEEGLLTT